MAIIEGTPGDDPIYGGENSDTIYGLAGNDSLFGLRGSDKLYGGDGNDFLSGGRGGDTLDGGAGNDILLGGDANDILTGGTGADMFVFDVFNGQKKVTDFDAEEDTLVLVGLPEGTTAADLLPYVTQEGDDLVFEAFNVRISLEGVQLSDMTIDDVMFV